MKSVHIRQGIARIMVETWLFWAWARKAREVVSIMMGPNAFEMAHGEYPNGARTQNPYVLVKLNSASAMLKCWTCWKGNIFYQWKCKCRLLVKRGIALLLRRAWKLTLNQRINATVTVIFSSVYSTTKIIIVPWKSINCTTMHETCLKPASDFSLS